MRHILGVDVIPTNNENILHLFDTSLYVAGLNITCPRLEIVIPGFKNYRLIEPVEHFNLALNGIDLDIINIQTNILPPLPDGLYTIKYSVSPNDYVNIEFDYLRTVIFKKKLFAKRCQFELSNCAPSEDVKAGIKIINDIEDYVKAAIAQTGCGNSDKALMLFNYANILLDRLENKC